MHTQAKNGHKDTHITQMSRSVRNQKHYRCPEKTQGWADKHGGGHINTPVDLHIKAPFNVIVQ